MAMEDLDTLEYLALSTSFGTLVSEDITLSQVNSIELWGTI
jgi:hypothetical protein